MEAVDLPTNQAVAAQQEFAPDCDIVGGVSSAVQLSKRLDVWLINSGLTQLARGGEGAWLERCFDDVLTCKSDRPTSAHQQNDYFIQSGMMRCFSELPTAKCNAVVVLPTTLWNEPTVTIVCLVLSSSALFYNLNA